MSLRGVYMIIYKGKTNHHVQMERLKNQTAFHIISRSLHSGFKLRDSILLKIRNFDLLTKNSLSPPLKTLKATWKETSQMETKELC